MKYFYLSISRKPEKKYMITYINDITGRLNTIYFGNAGSSDFIISNNLNERRAYLKRHKKNENWYDPYSAGFYSRWLLWNLDTLDASIDFVERKFNIEIHKQAILNRFNE